MLSFGKTILQDIKRTTIVKRIAVPKLDSTLEIPIFCKNGRKRSKYGRKHSVNNPFIIFY